MDAGEARARFAAAPVARLATCGPDGPHVVPIVFAVVDDAIVFAVDAKPKRHRRLKRLANLASDPRASILVDHYDDDWTRLWWVRVDGTAEILEAPDAMAPYLSGLAAKYPHYLSSPPPGPVVRITPTRWSFWDAAST